MPPQSQPQISTDFKSSQQAIAAGLPRCATSTLKEIFTPQLADLVEMYPDAKIVLNVRKGGAADWEASMKFTIAPLYSRKYRVANFWSVPSSWHYLAEERWQNFVREKFGVDTFWEASAYDAHNEWVEKVAHEHGRKVRVWELRMG
ncbi:uncharacterized protein Z518_01235 [Rhinocladiella mackenziei CBS 650.93]|uniref:Rhinocladiella mackenziei CBS 650.93 unplaced genomic scaffold supercont1.1, whole genome shotgun sequence n=1 Tax=Rhinocladiella mackenziei CBS 650.93 TaxID=1442369 RepID=A0A0D2IVT6_9EURO|nr:uncharacterized protein Z518_01235 [Rhinocladiella mackenziei CBS 650.93]KIX10154.1 hypothetical protein Z518_01235 [Rhinocladiella mackenziei CBS 650.93]